MKQKTKSRLALLLLLVALGGHTRIVLAQSPGKFTATANMTAPRSGHSATLLPDGTVLIAGGMSSFSTPAQASAELFDPATGTFAPTGSMTTPRSGHSATLLPNGKVLIAGGVGGRGTGYALAELYDPSTGTFAATGALVEHGGNTGVLLNGPAKLPNNGNVLIFGAVLNLYDPATASFVSAGAVGIPFFDSATLLADGRVLITGRDPDLDRVSHAQIYDPSTGAFISTGDATSGHSGPTGTLLLNGKVLIAGGDFGDGDGGSTVAELYDPATGAFSSTGTLVTGREQDSATLLSDGRVLFAGGHWDLPNAEVYSPDTGTFNYFADMLTGRETFQTTLLNDGRVLITGGSTYDPSAASADTHPVVSKAELYTPAAVVPSPVLFSLSGDGRGQGAIWHALTGQIASAHNPAVAGEALSMYTKNLIDGAAIPPRVAVGGQLAEILFFGDAPGYPGYSQINFRVPGGVESGSTVSVRLTYLDRPSNAVAIGVR